MWNEARRQLRQDPRWDTTELLELSDKERLFQEHTAGLVERKRLQFRRLLEETSQVRTYVHVYHTIADTLHESHLWCMYELCVCAVCAVSIIVCCALLCTLSPLLCAVCYCPDISGDAVEEGEKADPRGPSLQDLHRV